MGAVGCFFLSVGRVTHLYVPLLLRLLEVDGITVLWISNPMYLETCNCNLLVPLTNFKLLEIGHQKA